MIVWDIHDMYPDVKTAISELELKLQTAIQGKEKILKIIHGYGSSGVGGLTKRAVECFVRQKFQSGQIKLGICCDKMNIMNDKVAQIFRLSYSKNVPNEDKKNSNPGITYIFL